MLPTFERRLNNLHALLGQRQSGERRSQLDAAGPPALSCRIIQHSDKQAALTVLALIGAVRSCPRPGTEPAEAVASVASGPAQQPTSAASVPRTHKHPRRRTRQFYHGLMFSSAVGEP